MRQTHKLTSKKYQRDPKKPNIVEFTINFDTHTHIIDALHTHQYIVQ